MSQCNPAQKQYDNEKRKKCSLFIVMSLFDIEHSTNGYKILLDKASSQYFGKIGKNQI
jgi:hypothetical protein